MFLVSGHSCRRKPDIMRRSDLSAGVVCRPGRLWKSPKGPIEVVAIAVVAIVLGFQNPSASAAGSPPLAAEKALEIQVESVTLAADEGLVAWWKFDEGKGNAALDTVTGRQDAIRRNLTYVSGVSGTALKSDGFTTHIIRKASEAPAPPNCL